MSANTPALTGGSRLNLAERVVLTLERLQVALGVAEVVRQLVDDRLADLALQLLGIGVILFERSLVDDDPVQRLVVTAEPVTSIDVTAADVLSDLRETLKADGIEMCWAEMKDPVKDKLRRFGLMERFGEASFFATIGEAVSAYLDSRPVDWVDWGDSTR